MVIKMRQRMRSSSGPVQALHPRPGPWALGGFAVYVLVDRTVGWDKVGRGLKEAAKRAFENTDDDVAVKAVRQKAEAEEAARQEAAAAQQAQQTTHEARSKDSSSEGRIRKQDRAPDLSESKEKELLGTKDNRGKHPEKDRSLQGTQDQQQDLRANQAKQRKAGRSSIESTGKTDQNASTARRRIRSSGDLKPEDKQ